MAVGDPCCFGVWQGVHSSGCRYYGQTTTSFSPVPFVLKQDCPVTNCFNNWEDCEDHKHLMNAPQFFPNSEGKQNGKYNWDGGYTFKIYLEKKPEIDSDGTDLAVETDAIEITIKSNAKARFDNFRVPVEVQDTVDWEILQGAMDKIEQRHKPKPVTLSAGGTITNHYLHHPGAMCDQPAGGSHARDCTWT